MTINCKLCGEMFKSLIVDRQLATKEVTESLAKHLEKKHVKEFTNIKVGVQQSIPLYVWFINLNTFANIPEREEYLRAELQKAADFVMNLLGFVEDEEDELDENDEDEELEPVSKDDKKCENSAQFEKIGN